MTKERVRNWGNGQEGKRARKRKKGLEEVRNGGTQITRAEQKRMTADQIIKERRKRSIREGEKDKGIQI